MKYLNSLALTSVAVLLAACGGGSDTGGSTSVDNSGARGSLVHNPPLRVTGMTAPEFASRLAETASGKSLLQIAGTPKCGVNFHYMEYGTVGGANEATNATGAIMVPTGSDPACAGARPIVLYAHGTTTDRAYNIADILDPARPGASEGSLLGAMYAAQGFIVVAPNYAGYDASRLAYHPYLNADQQSKEMIDSLAAARKALPNIGSADSGKLLLTGYSQGGHVAMATHRALQAAGQTVTASAPMSGPYALAAQGEATYFGNVNLGSTIFTPMLVTSFQRAYGNIYTNLTDVYEPAFAPGMDTLLPSTTPLGTLISEGKLPQTALFSSTVPTAPTPQLQALFNSITPPTTPPALAPLFALGFGAKNLVTNKSRVDFLLDALANPDGAVPAVTTGGTATAPAHPMRKALKANDLRNWSPKRPVMLCGGNGDPTVFYSLNTQVMQGLWSAPSPLAPPAGLLTVLDVDSASPGAGDPFAAVRAGFAQAKAATYASGGANAVVQAYHGGLVPPFCNAAARGFFQQVLASGI
jgi:dienelactone hydrolase